MSRANPTPDEIYGARFNARMTQATAAAVIGSKQNSWSQWEAGKNKMPPALFELFLRKTGQFSKKKATAALQAI